MLVSLTVGKVDAGVAVLLTEDKRIIEFPSILLPADIRSGSIVDVDVSRNTDAEAQAVKSFNALQSEILSAFGSETPATPQLRCRNATQTSVVLDWDPISLGAADLRSLTLYRNGNKAGAIPKPFENTSTKISGLAVDQEYTFSLVLRTSGGTYSSDRLVVRTHKMTDLSGITVTPGPMAAQLRESLESTVEKIGAKFVEQVRIDTTHFVCTEGKGAAWEKALEMNVPVVVPDWVKGCEREGRIVGVRGYYLNADPRLRQMGPGSSLQREESQASVTTTRSAQQQQQQQQQQQSDAPPPSRGQTQLGVPATEVTPPTPETRHAGRESESDDDDDEGEQYEEVGGASRDASAAGSRENLPNRTREQLDEKASARDEESSDEDGHGAGGAHADSDEGDLGGGQGGGDEAFDDVKL